MPAQEGTAALKRVPSDFTRTTRHLAAWVAVSPDDVRVTPRDWLRNPDRLGKSAKAEWLKAGSDDPGILAVYSAAFLHHMFACQVADALREEGFSAIWLAEHAGLKQRHLSHVLRGRQAVTLPTMVAIIRALDRVELLPAPSSLAHLAP